MFRDVFSSVFVVKIQEALLVDREGSSVTNCDHRMSWIFLIDIFYVILVSLYSLLVGFSLSVSVAKIT